MAVHHDKLLRFLRQHGTPEKCTNKGDPKTGLLPDGLLWETIGKDPESIAGTFTFLADAIDAGFFD